MVVARCAVAVSCLAQVSRSDLVSLTITSKSYRSLVASPELCRARSLMGNTEAYFYVCLRIVPETTPRWFILTPNLRRLSPIPSNPKQAPDSSSFVVVDHGIYVIGGMENGKRTLDVWFLDCFSHTWSRVPSMKMARASASSNLIDGKIHVFGGLADCSNWAEAKEVFDPNTQTWDSWFTEQVADNIGKNLYSADIQQSVVIDNHGMRVIFAVDEDGQSFCIVPSNGIALGKTDSKQPGHRDDWCVIGKELYCYGTRRRILYMCLDWKEVKCSGLDDLYGWIRRWGRPATFVKYDISKLCSNSAGNIVIFWNKQLEGVEGIWSFGLLRFPWRDARELGEVWGKSEWSGAVFKLYPDFSHSYSVKVLYAASVYV